MKTITNKEAFAPIEHELNIPIDHSQFDFQFTRNWFRARNQKTWSSFLLPHFNYWQLKVNVRPIKMIQIGVFEGADLVWCLQNILTHPDSRVIAIDPWAATTKLDEAYMQAVEERARHNLSPWKDKVEILKGFSCDRLPEILHQSNGVDTFDLCVIDGDHTKNAVYTDALFCFDLTNEGGWLVFDDVRNRIPKPDHVVHGIEKFLDAGYGEHIKLEWQHRYCDCYSVN